MREIYLHLINLMIGIILIIGLLGNVWYFLPVAIEAVCIGFFIRHLNRHHQGWW